jgi:hypothetical protein
LPQALQAKTDDTSIWADEQRRTVSSLYFPFQVVNSTDHQDRDTEGVTNQPGCFIYGYILERGKKELGLGWK